MMGNHKNSVWVIAEQIRGDIPGVSLELIGQARKIADDLGVVVEAVLLGNGISDQVELLFFSGVQEPFFIRKAASSGRFSC